VSCLSTRAATAIATSGVATALAADSSSSSGHGFARHYTMYKLPKIHTHKIYHYSQQRLFTYRVTNQCLRTSQPQQQPATIVVTAAALQCSVSKYIHSLNSLFNPRKQYTVSNIFTYRFKVIIGGVLSVGVVHSAAQCNVYAKRFQNCSIYCKNTYFASL